MLGREQARLDIFVADGREISADDFELGVVANVIDGHLKHPEVVVCDGAEGAACNEDDGHSRSIAPLSLEAVGGKHVREGGPSRRLGHGVGVAPK